MVKEMSTNVASKQEVLAEHFAMLFTGSVETSLCRCGIGGIRKHLGDVLIAVFWQAFSIVHSGSLVPSDETGAA